MTRPIFHIAILLGICLGLWSCVSPNDPPSFREVRLDGSFSASDTALPFKGAIAADAGGIHLDFKVFEGSVDQTERFALRGAAPGASTTFWNLATDARLRLVNHSAATGAYELVLIVVDGDGIGDSIRIPFTVGATGIRYTPWIPISLNLSLADEKTGMDLEQNILVSLSDPQSKDATFFLTYQASSGAAGTLYWLALVSPARLQPRLAFAPARDDVLFLDEVDYDLSTPAEKVMAYLEGGVPLDSKVDLTSSHVVLLKTGSGLVAMFRVVSSVANATSGRVRLEGFFSRPY